MAAEASLISDNEVVNILSVINDKYSSISQLNEASSSHAVVVVADGFGMLGLEDSLNDQQMVSRYTFKNMNRMTVQVITYGATITSIRVPDQHGVSEDVLLGFDNLSDVKLTLKPIILTSGAHLAVAAIDTRMGLRKRTIISATNCTAFTSRIGPHIYVNQLFALTQLTLTLVTECGSNENAATVMARATFELKADNSFHVNYGATTSRPTPVNLTSNYFFNLAGHQGSHAELYKHIVTINADRIIEQDNNERRTPTGRILCVGATIMDLRVPHELGPAISRCPTGGYDHLMCLTQGTDQQLTFAARVVHPVSGRSLEMYTDQPLLKFYTANRLPDPFNEINPREVYTQDFFELPNFASPERNSSGDAACDEIMCEDENDITGEEMDSCSCSSISGCSTARPPIRGKKGAQYMRHAAFCLNSQNFPGHTNFPYPILNPGQMYSHEIVYKFGLRNCLVADQFLFSDATAFAEDDEFDGLEAEEHLEDEDVPLE